MECVCEGEESKSSSAAAVISTLSLGTVLGTSNSSSDDGDDDEGTDVDLAASRAATSAGQCYFGRGGGEGYKAQVCAGWRQASVARNIDDDDGGGGGDDDVVDTSVDNELGVLRVN